jgi:hypothetical protein
MGARKAAAGWSGGRGRKSWSRNRVHAPSRKGQLRVFIITSPYLPDLPLPHSPCSPCSPCLFAPRHEQKIKQQAAPMHHARDVVWGTKANGRAPGGPGGSGDLEMRVTARIGIGKALPRPYFVVPNNSEPRTSKNREICSRPWHESSSLGRHVGSGPVSRRGVFLLGPLYRSSSSCSQYLVWKYCSEELSCCASPIKLVCM